ncbi:MAG TPA: preprotein translocase subunit YajC [Candidatus Hydrogenedens sp.]|nr:preprotein translocase subunit YajC [Candidatus Hydrogenedens sp.]
MWKFLFAQTEEAVPAEAATSAAQQAAQQTTTSTPSLWGSMLPMILAFIAIMYFLMIRPQQKREKERREMLNSVAKGDKVITTGGMYGTVVDLSDEKVTLRVDDKVEVDFVRGAVSQIVSKADGDVAKKK